MLHTWGVGGRQSSQARPKCKPTPAQLYKNAWICTKGSSKSKPKSQAESSQGKAAPRRPKSKTSSRRMDMHQRDMILGSKLTLVYAYMAHTAAAETTNTAHVSMFCILKGYRFCTAEKRVAFIFYGP